MKVLWRLAITGLMLVIVVAASAAAAWALSGAQRGERPGGPRLVRIAQSPQWRGGRFVNRLARQDGPILESAGRFFFGGGSSFSAPDTPLRVEQRTRADYAASPASGLRITWLASVRALAARGTRFVVPLGIGARLEGWGVSLAQITELDWWESTSAGGLNISSTPSRHFSGRWLNDADATL